MVLIGILRFIPALIDNFSTKKVSKGGHLYNILVVLNAEEMAVLENIRHEDISFFRKMTKESAEDSLSWQMNDTSKILSKHHEVKFFDVYDLLGEGGMSEHDEIIVDHSIKGNKLVTKEAYKHQARLQTGMIIQVQPASDWKHKGSFDDLQSINSDADIESNKGAIVRLKKGGQSASVLHQLPKCFSTKIPSAKSSGLDKDFRSISALEASYSDDVAHHGDSTLPRAGRDMTNTCGHSDVDSLGSNSSKARTSPTHNLCNSSLLLRHSRMQDERAARDLDDDSDLDSTPRKSIRSQDATAVCTPRSMSCIAGAEDSSRWSPVSSKSYKNEGWVQEKWKWRDEQDSDDAMESYRDKGREEKEYEGDGSLYEEEKLDDDFYLETFEVEE